MEDRIEVFDKKLEFGSTMPQYGIVNLVAIVGSRVMNFARCILDRR